MIDVSPLPRPVVEQTSPGHVVHAPQLNPVSWAFTAGLAEQLTSTELLVLVAVAHYAECASWSGDGAGPIHADVLVQLTGLRGPAVVEAVRHLVADGLLNRVEGHAGCASLPLHVWNGEWAR